MQNKEKVNIDQNRIEVIGDYSDNTNTEITDKGNIMNDTLNELKTMLVYGFHELKEHLNSTNPSSDKDQEKINISLFNQFLLKLSHAQEKTDKTISENNDVILGETTKIQEKTDNSNVFLKIPDGQLTTDKTNDNTITLKETDDEQKRIIKENNTLLNQFLNKLNLIDEKDNIDADKADVFDRNESLVDHLDELNDNLKDLNKKDFGGSGKDSGILGLLGGMLSKIGDAVTTGGAVATGVGGAAVAGGAAGLLARILPRILPFLATRALPVLGIGTLGAGGYVLGEKAGEYVADKLREKDENGKPKFKPALGGGKSQAQANYEYEQQNKDKPKKSAWDQAKDMFDETKRIFGFDDKNEKKVEGSNSDGKEIEGGDMQSKVYNAFIHAGFSKNQALALTAEVGRETGYQSKNLFGTWDDSNRENSGMISWTGTRRTKLLQFLKTKGVIDKNGKIIPGQKALDAQAEFVMKEMKEDKSYNRTKTEFLENPNVSQEKAAEVLGKNYIRWDMKNLPQHKEVVKKYYSKIKNSVVNEENNATASKQVNTKPQTSKIEKPVKTSQLIKADEKNEISTKNKKKETVASNGVIVNQPNTVNNNNTTVVSANLKPYIEDESYHMLTAKTGCYQAFTV